MYPTVIEAFNISIDTLRENGDIVVDEDKRFTSKFVGLTPSILKRLRPLRWKVKEQLAVETDEDKKFHLKLLSDAYKRVINAVYGYYGYSGKRVASRLYSPVVAEAITRSARRLLEETVRILEDMGYRIVYGDTDSVFIHGIQPGTEQQVLDECLNMLESWLHQHNAMSYNIKMSAEKCDRLFILTKKRYAYKQGDRYVVKGVEVVRRDIGRYQQKCILEAIKMILDGEDYHTIAEKCRQFIREFRNQPLTEIAYPRKLHTVPEHYAVCSQHLKAFLYSRQIGIDLLPEERFYMVELRRIPRGYPDSITFRGRRIKVRELAFRYPHQIPREFLDCIDFDGMCRKTLIGKLQNLIGVVMTWWRRD